MDIQNTDSNIEEKREKDKKWQVACIERLVINHDTWKSRIRLSDFRNDILIFTEATSLWYSNHSATENASFHYLLGIYLMDIDHNQLSSIIKKSQ